jgi:hypothetical protein
VPQLSSTAPGSCSSCLGLRPDRDPQPRSGRPSCGSCTLCQISTANFRSTCTVVVFSLLVGARRRSAVRCGAERSGATARLKGFEEQSELEALSVFNGM